MTLSACSIFSAELLKLFLVRKFNNRMKKMRMNRIKLLSIILLVMVATSVFAQDATKRLGFEFNAGASFATNKPGDVKLKPGFGFEGIFHYQLLPSIGAYGGWGWNKFDSKDTSVGADVSFEETGYVLGIQFKKPIGSLPWCYYLRAGALVNHIEIENNDGEIIADTGHGLGFQLAAGVEYELGKNWCFVPGVKFNYLKRDLEIEGITTDLKHSYLSLRVGFVKRF